MAASETEFEFADFFVDESDPGVEEPITLEDNNGVQHDMVWTVRRSISLGDIQAARSAATHTHLTPNGQQVVDKFDDVLFAIHLLARVVLKWPFTRNGAMIPVTVAYVTKLNARNSNALNLLAGKLTNQQSEKTLADFEKPSDVVF